MNIVSFWRQAALVPRSALVSAGVAAAVNVASFAGLTFDAAWGTPAVVHIAIMVLGFALFLRLRARSRSYRTGTAPMTAPRSVPVLTWGTVFALLYTVALVLAMTNIYEEGSAVVRGEREVWVTPNAVERVLPPGSVAVFDARVLRLFSAAWIFFGLLVARIYPQAASVHRREPAN